MAYNVFLKKTDAYVHCLANTKTYEDAEVVLSHLVKFFEGRYQESDFGIQETPFYTGS